MLNKTELLELAGQVATVLHEYESKAERAKKTNLQLSEEIRNATNLKDFLDKIGKLLVVLPSIATTDFHIGIEQVVKMPSDQLPLFIALIRFEYNFQQAQIHQ